MHMHDGLFGRDIISFGELHILRNINNHRTGATCARHVEGLMNGAGQIIRVFHQDVMLGTGAGDACGVGFLECIRADQEGRDLTRKTDNRNRIH